MIISRDQLTALGLDLKFCENFILVGEGPYKEFSSPMVDINNNDINILTEKIF